MTTVDQLIGDLLLRHNCVIIPSFGGFVAKAVSAQIDYKNGTMIPPGKSLLFNRQLINNDGLLINELSQANGLSFDEASLEVKQRVASWNEDLKTGGRIEIDRVGNLFFDEERNICFEQDRFFNLLLESFGLGTVHFLTEEDVQIVEKTIALKSSINEEIIEPVVAIQVEEVVTPNEKTIEVETPIIQISAPRLKKKEPETIESTETRKRKPWRYIAAACFLPIAFYSIWIPMKTDVLESGIISFNDFNPFHESSEALYIKKEFKKDLTIEKLEKETLEDEISDLDPDKKNYTYQFDTETYIDVDLPESETSITVEPVVENQNNFDVQKMNYIVGCFGDKANADNLVAKLNSNGLNARIYDNKNGLHRVTAGSAISIDAYYEIKSKADSMGLSGWKLK